MAAQKSSRGASKGRGSSLRSGKKSNVQRVVFGVEVSVLAGLSLAFVALGALGGLFMAYSRDLPSLEPLQDYDQSGSWGQSTSVYDRNGDLIGQFYEEDRQILRYDQIPPMMINALLAVEDKRFWDHSGIDFIRLTNAFVQSATMARRVRGTSTLTQQLSRDLFLTRERSIERKIKEMILALRIEDAFTKEEILERYLNKTYFGNGAYGLAAAARRYFNKDLTQDTETLTLGEAALIAGLPQAPSGYNPVLHPEAAQARQKIVLSLMVNQGFCSREEADAAYEEFWARFIPPSQIREDEVTIIAASRSRAPWFLEYVRQQMQESWDYDAIYRGGLKVYTTIDLRMQAEAERAVADGVGRLRQEIARRRGVSVEALGNDLQAALICLDPRTGEILAMVGGDHFGVDNQLNRTVQSLRQPGSAFKPFVYTEALQQGYTLANTLIDAPVEIDLGGGRIWSPSNYSHTYSYEVTLRYALEKSINIPVVSLGQQVGLQNVVSLARSLGIRSPMEPYPSLPLGAFEVRPIEICAAYAAMDNGGIWNEPHGILEVADSHGRVLQQCIPQSREVLSPQIAYLITYAMQGVVQRGTGAGAVGARLGRPAAGKTGTTDDYSDAWFVGYTPQLCTAVWVGNDRASVSMGRGFEGAHAAAPIWTDFMKAASSDLPVEDFPVPSGITFVDIDRMSGLLASPLSTQVIREAFINGSEPLVQYSASGLGQPDATYSLSPFSDDGFVPAGGSENLPLRPDQGAGAAGASAAIPNRADTNVIRPSRGPRLSSPAPQN